MCAIAAAVAAAAGCSRQETVSDCATDSRYSTARSAPPVQVPDDLSPPNESDALRLPPDAAVGAPTAQPGCLESPPSFCGDERPFASSADTGESERQRRRERRRERDAEPEQDPAEQAEQAEQPASNDDRIIDN